MVTLSSRPLGEGGILSWNGKNLPIKPPANLSSHLFGPSYSRRDAISLRSNRPHPKVRIKFKVRDFIGEGWIPEQHSVSVRKEEWRMQNGAATSNALYNKPPSYS